MIQLKTYNEDQAAKVGILGRVFSGEVKKVKAGVIHEAKRYSILETAASRSIEVGVAIRLSVATSKWGASLELTVANLAADAQLNGTEAGVGITVVGYTGPLGHILPAPKRLDVESCREYLEAFKRMQAVIFGEEGWQNLVPTALSFEDSFSPSRDAHDDKND